MPPHPLTNFEIQRYYQNETKSNGVYLRNNLPKINHGANVINFDEHQSIWTHWIALNGDNVIYFNSFEVEYIPKETKRFIGN